MHRTHSLAALAICGFVGFVPGQRNYTRSAGTTQDPLPQGAVNDAIQSGIAYLERAQADGHWVYEQTPFARFPTQRPGGDDFHGGLTALAMYALASSGVSADEESIQSGIDWCKKHPHPFDAGGKRATYCASLLVLALCRIDPAKHKKWIHELASRIAGSQLPNGMWNYDLRQRGKKVGSKQNPGGRPWAWLSNGDGSNTQFAVLALWSAQTMAQFRTPSRVWQRVRGFHERTQHANGGWSYKEPRKRGKGKTVRPGRGAEPGAPAWMYDPSPAMTAAGISAYTCAIASTNGGSRGLPKARKAKVAKRGLEAFEANRKRWDSLLDDYYFAYSVERVGSLHALPDKDWYAPLAKRLVNRQARDGRWRANRGKVGVNYGDKQQVYETSLALLCLAKATRHPITPRGPRKQK